MLFIRRTPGAHLALWALSLSLCLREAHPLVPRPLHTGIGIPKSDLAPGMVMDGGWEVPAGATGWERLNAMAESSWKRSETVWGDLEAQFADKRLQELGFKTHMNGSIVSPEIPPGWAQPQERLVMPKRQYDLLWSVYMDIMKVEGCFAGVKNGTDEYALREQSGRETFERLFGYKDFDVIPDGVYERDVKVCATCVKLSFWRQEDVRF
jgi:hypothetical protein